MPTAISRLRPCEGASLRRRAAAASCVGATERDRRAVGGAAAQDEIPNARCDNRSGGAAARRLGRALSQGSERVGPLRLSGHPRDLHQPAAPAQWLLADSARGSDCRSGAGNKSFALWPGSATIGYSHNCRAMARVVCDSHPPAAWPAPAAVGSERASRVSMARRWIPTVAVPVVRDETGRRASSSRDFPAPAVPGASRGRADFPLPLTMACSEGSPNAGRRSSSQVERELAGPVCAGPAHSHTAAALAIPSETRAAASRAPRSPGCRSLPSRA